AGQQITDSGDARAYARSKRILSIDFDRAAAVLRTKPSGVGMKNGWSADGSRRRQPAHERFAASQLLQRDELVRLVRLRDAPRAADHGGDAGVAEDAGLGAE